MSVTKVLQLIHPRRSRFRLRPTIPFHSHNHLHDQQPPNCSTKRHARRSCCLSRLFWICLIVLSMRHPKPALVIDAFRNPIPNLPWFTSRRVSVSSNLVSIRAGLRNGSPTFFISRLWDRRAGISLCAPDLSRCPATAISRLRHSTRGDLLLLWNAVTRAPISTSARESIWPPSPSM